MANLSSTSAFNFGFGFAELINTNGRQVRWSGELAFVTPNTLVRGCVGDEVVQCTAEIFFQFDGILHAFDFPSDAHLADFDLTGHGRASGFFESDVSVPLALNYVFQTSTVPEPSSLLLVGSVIVDRAVRRWRARIRRLWRHRPCA